ncbi:tetratricopeptide repeat protein [Clostridium paraputrificum]|uniref:tetratricopeptide repeat protein n=1 Tax=Clostridium paraputrificum TaxID=29363 RepID=UPI003D32A8ED
MNRWYVLGIEETKDKEAIKEAYYEKLNTVHPEEDPEGFKELREAYEELIKACDEEEEAEDNSEVGIWMRDVKRVYNNFSLRLDEDLWKELFEVDVCYCIDTKNEALTELLTFLMDKYYLPHNVWILINSIFDIKERKKELSESFPSDFIDFVISKIDYDEILNYNLFKIEDGKDYDRSIYLFNKVRRQIFSGETEKIDEELKELKALNIEHPYFSALEGRVLLCHRETEKAKILIAGILKDYPKELEVLSVMAEVYWIEENYEEALKYYEMELEIDPNNFNALSGKGDSLKELKSFEEAKGIYVKLIERDSYDDYIRGKIYETNELLVNYYEEKLEENCNDDDIKFKLAWILFENGAADKGLKVLEKIEAQEENKNYQQYLDLSGRLNYVTENYEKSYDDYDKWEAVVKEKGDDLLSYIYSQKARALGKLEKFNEALNYYEKIIHLVGESTVYLNSMAEIQYNLKKYNESISLSERSLEINDYQTEGYINRAKAYMKIRFDREALDDTYKAIAVYPYIIEPYIMQLELYIKYEDYDSAFEVIKKVESIGFNDDRICIYKIKALIGANKYDEAKLNCLNELERASKGEILEKEIIAEINYQMAIAYSDTGDYPNGINYIEEAIKFNDDIYDYFYFKAYVYQNMNEFNKALKIYDDMALIDEDSIYSLRCKGKLLTQLKKYDEAIETFQEIKRIDPQSDFANGSIYGIYREQNNITQGLKYLDMQLEVAPSSYHYIEKGIILADKDDFEEAKLSYEKALEIEPDNKYALNNIAVLYQNRHEYEEAIRYYEQAVDYDSENEFSDCVENIVRCYERLGNRERAVEVIEKNLKDYNEASLYSSLGKLFYKEKRYEEAIRTYNKIIYSDDFSINDEEKANHLVEMGECFELLDMYEKSIEAYSKAIKFNESHKSAYERLADVYAYLGDSKKAIFYMEKQIKVSPDDTTCLMKMGEILKLLGKSWRAKKYFKRALDVYKKSGEDDACTNNYIGRCLCGLGNVDNGNKYLNRAITLGKDCEDCPHEECFEAYWTLGNNLVLEGDYIEALKTFESANTFKGEEDIDVVRAIRMLKKKMK